MVVLAVVLASAAAAEPPRVSQVRVGSAPYRVTAAGRTLWAAVYGSGTVVRLDPASGKVVRRYRVGGGPGAIRVVNGVVWLGNYVGNSIIRLDPARRRVRRIRVGAKPIALDVGGGAVWVADLSDGRVTKLSAGTGKILLRRSFAESHEGLVVQPDGIWVTSEGGVIHKLDPKTGRTLLTRRRRLRHRRRRLDLGLLLPRRAALATRSGDRKSAADDPGRRGRTGNGSRRRLRLAGELRHGAPAPRRRHHRSRRRELPHRPAATRGRVHRRQRLGGEFGGFDADARPRALRSPSL
jgi:streptogramin lyase